MHCIHNKIKVIFIFKLYAFILLFPVFCQAQTSFQIGLGLGVDLGLRSDYTVNYILKRKNSSSVSLDLLTKFETSKRYSFYPIVSATIINFNFGMENTLGENNPDGDILSVENTGNIPTDRYEINYLSKNSKGKTARFSAGGIISYELLPNLELGSGLFYTLRRTVIRDYNATDQYEYFGATGTHTSHYQTDEYEFIDTEIDKEEVNYFDILENEISVPVLAKYNFRTNSGMSFSPFVIAYIGKDIFYKIGFCYTIDLDIINQRFE